MDIFFSFRPVLDLRPCYFPSHPDGNKAQTSYWTRSGLPWLMWRRGLDQRKETSQQTPPPLKGSLSSLAGFHGGTTLCQVWFPWPWFSSWHTICNFAFTPGSHMILNQPSHTAIFLESSRARFIRCRLIAPKIDPVIKHCTVNEINLFEALITYQ